MIETVRRAQLSMYAHFSGLSVVMLLADTIRTSDLTKSLPTEASEAVFRTLYLLIINVLISEISLELSNEEIDYVSEVLIGQLFANSSLPQKTLSQKVKGLLMQASENYRLGIKPAVIRRTKDLSKMLGKEITDCLVENIVSGVIDSARADEKNTAFFRKCLQTNIDDTRMVEFLKNTGY